MNAGAVMENRSQAARKDGQNFSDGTVMLVRTSVAVQLCCRVRGASGAACSLPCRPVKRAVQRELETTLAKALLRGEFGEDDTVVVDADEKGIVLRKGRSASEAMEAEVVGAGAASSSA